MGGAGAHEDKDGARCALRAGVTAVVSKKSRLISAVLWSATGCGRGRDNPAAQPPPLVLPPQPSLSALDRRGHEQVDAVRWRRGRRSRPRHRVGLCPRWVSLSPHPPRPDVILAPAHRLGRRPYEAAAWADTRHTPTATRAKTRPSASSRPPTRPSPRRTRHNRPPTSTATPSTCTGPMPPSPTLSTTASSPTGTPPDAPSTTP